MHARPFPPLGESKKPWVLASAAATVSVELRSLSSAVKNLSRDSNNLLQSDCTSQLKAFYQALSPGGGRGLMHETVFGAAQG